MTWHGRQILKDLNEVFPFHYLDSFCVNWKLEFV